MAASRSHKNQQRNYRKEYDQYQGKPVQIKNRGMRNAARREYETAHGSLPASTDVDHIKPIVKGGGNTLSNLRPRPKHSNRSFQRTKTAGMA